MSISVKKSTSSSNATRICPICNTKHVTEVYMEVINLSAQETASLQTCLTCATYLSVLTWTQIKADFDHMLYTELGIVSGNN